MVKVYLHAGLPKTGTTTVQNWLVENAARLRERNIFTFADIELGHRLAIEGIGDAERRSEPDINAISKRTLDEACIPLGAAAKDARTTLIVISSEYFSIADPALIRQLLARLSLDDITVLFLLRRQDRIIESGYNQDIRLMGATRPLDAASYHPVFDWHLLVSSWAEVFGPDKISLLLYEALTTEDSSVVPGIFAKIDPQLAGLAVAFPPSDERNNQSLPAALLEFQRLANRAGAQQILEILESASKFGLGGPPFRMDRKLAKSFLDLYRGSNLRVAQEYFGRHGDLFDESDLDGPQEGADYNGRLPLETLAELLALQMQTQRDNAQRQNERWKNIEAVTDQARSEIGLQGNELAEVFNSVAQLREISTRLESQILDDIDALKVAAEVERQRSNAQLEATRQHAKEEAAELKSIIDDQAAQLRDAVAALEELKEQTATPWRLVRHWWRTVTSRLYGE